MNTRTSTILVLVMAVIMLQAWLFIAKPQVQVTPVIEQTQDISISETVTAPEATEQAAAAQTQETISVEAMLSLELIGTAMGNVKDPIALIKDLDGGREGMYKTGHMVKDARVVRIVKGEVELDFNGKQVVLRTSEAKRLAKNVYSESEMILRDGEQITVNKKALIKDSRTVMKSLRQLKVKPAVEAQKVIGMKIEGVSDDNIAAVAGLRDKDIVTSINYQSINSYQKALQVVNKLRNQNEINISLLRDGKPLQLCYKMR